jgi:energy-coupling factor transport system substrate-specific component
LPFNVVHSASTVIFLLLLAKPMLDKLERIKTKYGLIQTLS